MDMDMDTITRLGQLPDFYNFSAITGSCTYYGSWYASYKVGIVSTHAI
jgi:hypothetical protein